MKNYLNSPGAFPRPKKRAGAFKEFDATELYCPRCQRSVPVRKRLLLVLPEGDKYDYRCAFCSESVGSKIDRKQKPLTIIG
ncbi:MAG: cytoplasmic protein [Proteobacteria bacterium]|nr:cytoplasmic protein [Pseudomonadota bacterium]